MLQSVLQIDVNHPNAPSHISFLISEFQNEITRLQHVKNSVLKEQNSKLELTKHSDGLNVEVNSQEEQIQMLIDYLLHVLQYGTPEERIKILAGVSSKFKLVDRQLTLL